MILAFSLQSCFDFGDETDDGINSPEAKENLTRYIGVELTKEVSDVHFYSNNTGIDPFCFAMFNADSSFINRIVEACKMEIDSTPVFNPHQSPEWYVPDLSSDYVKFSANSPGRGVSLAYDQTNGIAYYGHSSY